MKVLKPTTVIYNPNAGKKRQLLTLGAASTSLEEIKSLLSQYQIPASFVPTQKPGDALRIAARCAKRGDSLVLVAGGDGTVGEAANGLIKTKTTLGILPLGTFMNVAHMLSIPPEMEKAVALIKIGRTRKIDVGCITKMNGKKLDQSYYFLESVGIGMEAEVQQHLLHWERGNTAALLQILQALFKNFSGTLQITEKKKTRELSACYAIIANGPYTGASLKAAPRSKLNDHRLTVRLFHMTETELIGYFYDLFTKGKSTSKQIETFQTKHLRISSTTPMPLHADARLFGTTPAEFSIIPNALTVITGFPTPEDVSLKKKTLLDP